MVLAFSISVPLTRSHKYKIWSGLYLGILVKQYIVLIIVSKLRWAAFIWYVYRFDLTFPDLVWLAGCCYPLLHPPSKSLHPCLIPHLPFIPPLSSPVLSPIPFSSMFPLSVLAFPFSLVYPFPSSPDPTPHSLRKSSRTHMWFATIA